MVARVSTQGWFLTGCALILGAWIAAKFYLFYGFNYTSDLFCFIQSSRSWLQGRSFLYNSDFGVNGYNHNYFLVALFGPLVEVTGAGAFFVAYPLLCWLALKRLASDQRGSSSWRLILLAAMILGPIGFWIYDDPIYGFHPEIFFGPISVLFALSVVRGDRWQWVWGAALVANREEGAVIACAVHCAALVLRRPAIPARELVRVLTAVIAGWSAIFVLGLTVLRTFAPLADQRLGGAFAALIEARRSSQTEEALLASALGAAQMLSASLPAFFVVRFSVRSIIALLAFVPVALVAFVGTLAYVGDVYSLVAHGMTWPYRFSTLWYGVVVVLILSEPSRIAGRLRYLIVACLLIGAQHWALREARQYNIVARLRGPQPVGLLRDVERQVIECLARGIPRDQQVVSTGTMYAAFQLHDLVRGSDVAARGAKPAIFVCDVEGRLPFDYQCGAVAERFINSGYQGLRVNGLLIAAGGERLAQIKDCLPEGY